MTLEDVSQEPFPAVSICIPHSWKWPGIVKMISKMNPEFIKADMAEGGRAIRYVQCTQKFWANGLGIPDPGLSTINNGRFLL